MALSELKKAYAVYEKKDKLPSFSSLNQLFEIDRIERDTEYLLRDIRKVVMEKITEYMKLIEMLLNPTAAPQMFMQFAKKISIEERKLLESIYEKFIRFELSALDLDLDYNESKEADAIRTTYKMWTESISDIRKVLGFMRRNFESSPNKKERSYFG